MLPAMSLFHCPLCQQALQPQQRGYACPQRHHFDSARQGYVNLLPVQHKQSRQPGDTPAMITARRHFFEQGHYAPLQAAVLAALQAHPDPLGPVLDLGCGEGYYAGAIQATWPQSTVYGIDISKAAIRAAAQRYPACQFAVASSYRLPFGDGAFAQLLNIFAPLNPQEAARVLAPAGSLLLVSPAPQHLFEIKALLYATPQSHAEAAPSPAGWQVQETQRLQTHFVLKQIADLEALIQMTPYAWRLAQIPPQTLSAALPLQVSLDVWLQGCIPNALSTPSS